MSGELGSETVVLPFNSNSLTNNGMLRKLSAGNNGEGDENGGATKKSSTGSSSNEASPMRQRNLSNKIRSNVKKETGTLPGGNNKGKLFCRYWKPMDPNLVEKQPRALLFIAHGLHEHLDCYSEFATFLAQQDILVFGHDFHGHGMSEGQRGIVDDIDGTVRNVLLHCHQMKYEYKGVQLFIFGHSMGGFISIKACMANPAMFRGAIFEAPLISMDREIMSPLYRFFLSKLSSVIPQLPVFPLDFEDICDDHEGQRRLYEDPLRIKGQAKLLTVMTLVEEVRSLTWAQMTNFQVPFLILHGEDDTICQFKGSKLIHNFTRQVQDKGIIVIEGAKHNLLYEKEEVKMQVMMETLNWIRQRIE